MDRLFVRKNQSILGHIVFLIPLIFDFDVFFPGVFGDDFNHPVRHAVTALLVQ